MNEPIRKKLRHLIDGLVSEYVKQDYPLYVDFVKKFAEFLDEGLFGKMLHIDENVDIRYLFNELLDEFYQQYMKDVIDSNKYELSDENKRFFIEISKFFLNAKGKKLSFDLVLSYLQNFRVSNEDTHSTSIVENVEYLIQEPEENWGQYKYYYNGFVKHDNLYPYYSEDESGYFKPYTYRIETDQPKAIIWDLIEGTNPVGFYPEFRYVQIFTDEYGDIYDVIAIQLHFTFEDIVYTNLVYNGSVNYDNGIDEFYKYDAVHDYDGNSNYVSYSTEAGSVFYSSAFISEIFAFTVNYNPVDEYETDLMYNGFQTYDGLEQYDAYRNIKDVFGMLYTLKELVDELIITDEQSFVIGYDVIDAVEGHIYNNQHTYGELNNTYGCYSADFFYNNFTNYDRSQYHFGNVEEEVLPSTLYSFDQDKHPNYKLFDVLELYNAIITHTEETPIVGLSDLELCQEMATVLASHIPLTFSEIIPLYLIDSTHLIRNWTYFQYYMERIVEVYAAHVGWTIDQANSNIWTYINKPTGCLYDGNKDYYSEQEWYYKNDDYKDEISMAVGVHLHPFTDEFHFLETDVFLNDGRRTFGDQEFYNAVVYNGRDLLNINLGGTTPFEDDLDISDESTVIAHMATNLSDAMHTDGVYDGSLDYGYKSLNIQFYNTIATPTIFEDGNNNFDGIISYDGGYEFTNENNNPMLYDGVGLYTATASVFYGYAKYDDLLTTSVLCNVALVDELVLEETASMFMDGTYSYDRFIDYAPVQTIDYDLMNANIHLTSTDIFDDSNTQDTQETTISASMEMTDDINLVYMNGSISYNANAIFDRAYDDSIPTMYFDGSYYYDAIEGYTLMYGQGDLMTDDFVVNITQL